MTPYRCVRCHSDRLIYVSSAVSPGDEMELLQDVYRCDDCGKLVSVDCRTGQVVLNPADALKLSQQRAVQAMHEIAQRNPR
jgi:DNA-directed RNA polymerase subunit RPC12/RpoP